jgi:hypothetical protein
VWKGLGWKSFCPFSKDYEKGEVKIGVNHIMKISDNFNLSCSVTLNLWDGEISAMFNRIKGSWRVESGGAA